MLTEAETKEIERDAYSMAKVFAGTFKNGTATNDEIREARLAYQEAWTVCSTRMAEKKNVEIEKLTQMVSASVDKLEAAQEEIKKWQNWYERVANEYASKEIEIKDLQAELSRVKEELEITKEELGNALS